jgi:uncharacterized protein YdeI (YjbR/CyaY-like superfamily)
VATKKVGAATKKAATTTAATKKAAATTKAGTAMQAAPTTTAPRVRSTASGRKTAVDDDPIVFFADSAAFEAWLAAHHDRSSGVWLQHSKKGATRPSVSYAEALDVALCWGWIDGQKRSHDDESFLQRFSPRGARSIWSVINRDKVDALIAAGRMRPAGQRVVDDAKQDGRWDAAYASARTATVPDDLQAALDQVPAAAAFFAGL